MTITTNQLLLEAQMAQQKARRALEAWMDSTTLDPQVEYTLTFALLDIQMVLTAEAIKYDAALNKTHAD